MRTFVLALILAALVPISLAVPWIGVMTWTWISIMNPHKLTFGFLFDFPVAAVVGGATLVGLLITRERRMPPLNGVTLTLLMFIVWMCITSLYAVHPDRIGIMFSKVMKIQLMIFVTMMLVYRRRHLDIFVWVIALSLAFYGVKGGIFTLLHGGSGRVYGPPGGFIEGNNELALALTMCIPLLYYLRSTLRSTWAKHGMVLAMVFTALAVLGSHSRGALLAIIAMAIYLWRRSGRKVAVGAMLVTLGLMLVAFMPMAWDARMDTIVNYQHDGSALGRINAWHMAFNLAQHRFLGAGFDAWEPDMFALYAPNPTDVHAAHSIYFQVLGEHGFVGLALFVLLWWLTWRSATWVRRRSESLPGMEATSRLVSMTQAALIGYFVGGAFLSLAYFDVPYDLLAVIVILRAEVESILRHPETAAKPAEWRVTDRISEHRVG